MLMLIFRNTKPGSAAKGPLSCFRIDGELIRDENGAALARHGDHAWDVDGTRFLRMDCNDANTLQFQGRDGASSVYGPFTHFSSTDGVCYADHEVFAHYDAQTRLWFSHRNRQYWPALVVRAL